MLHVKQCILRFRFEAFKGLNPDFLKLYEYSKGIIEYL